MSSNANTISEIYAGNQKTKNVDTIFTWLKTQPHLPELTEQQVILFLHSCYYEIEATKTTIEYYFTLRTNSSLFQSGNDDLIRRVLSSYFVGILPKQTPEGFIILLIKLFDPNPEKFIFEEIIKVTVMVVCLHCHRGDLANGLVILFDSEGTGFGHLLRISVSIVRQFLQFVQEAAPTRLKNIHYINAVPVLKPLIAIAKPFMKREVHESMKIHSDYTNSLYDYIPKECLPDEYGGKLGPILGLHEKNLQSIVTQRDFFDWHDEQKVDETKREKKTRGFFGNIPTFFRQ